MNTIKDHREIGKELDLFSFNEYAPGAVFWHPKGLIIYQEIIKLIRSILNKSGYQEIKTPVMVKKSLFVKSGHWQHFGEHNIFNLAIHEDEEIAEFKKNPEKAVKEGTAEIINGMIQLTPNYSLKPMNCPESTLIYNSKNRSYKDLPLKYSDFGLLHRRELSGVIGGLFRLREFTIDDAHIYCTKNQIMSIITELLQQIKSFYKLFNFNIRFYLATKPEKALSLPNEPHLWDEAEDKLKTALKKESIKFEIKEKDGAFYGPKIDFHMTDFQNRNWQLATIQLDFQMPRSLGVVYTNQKGRKEYAVIIHRAFTGSIERFIGILIEHYAGAFPLWLSPVQAVILPVASRNVEAAQKAKNELIKSDIRVELDDENKTIPYKIRHYTLQKIPYLVIMGDKEGENNVSVRTREGKDLGRVSLYEFINKLKDQIEKFL